ncbi:MAG: hypothetical protein MOB07_20455, partial [Acidobacteria bacterium]|nr:hypothetical protein [Acidobacteriota bacterium]
SDSKARWDTKKAKRTKKAKFLALLPFLPFLPFLCSDFIPVNEADFVKVSRHQLDHLHTRLA